jgi:APA family basic amino acid/polyamine antiporter
MASLTVENWIRFFVWLAIGMVIYWTYSRHRSTLAKESAGAGGANS